LPTLATHPDSDSGWRRFKHTHIRRWQANIFWRWRSLNSFRNHQR
jgi:hypothetical protein